MIHSDIPSLKQLRESRGLSDKDVARAVGLHSHTTVSVWESYGFEPHKKYRRKLAACLGVTEERLEFSIASCCPNKNPEYGDEVPDGGQT